MAEQDEAPPITTQPNQMIGDEGRNKQMAINLQMPEVSELKPRITVFGVGGAGGNAVNNMIESGLVGCDFVVANTDAQALASSKAERVVQMGVAVTEGLGAGSMPEIGGEAAREVLDELSDHLSGAHMVFITAGMGGGTGTGAAPVIAQAAREMGILTVGVVTKPFFFEGQRRMRIADNGIDELQKHVDTLIVIPNQNLFRIANEKTTFADAFAMADQVLYSGVACITDLMVKEGLINLDFADVRSIMRGMGKAMMGTGEASGDQRAIQAAEAAIANPLLDETSMKGAQGLLISITGGNDMTLYEVDEAATRIREEVDQDANIILGATFDDSVEGAIRVSVVATGIDQAVAAQITPVKKAKPAMPGQPIEKAQRQPDLAPATPVTARTEQPLPTKVSVQPGPELAKPAPVRAAQPLPAAAPSASAPAPVDILLATRDTETAMAAKLEVDLDFDSDIRKGIAVTEDPDVTILPYRPDQTEITRTNLLDEAGTNKSAVEKPMRESFVPPAPEAPSDGRIPSIEEFPFIAQREAMARTRPEAEGTNQNRPMSLLKRLASGFNKREDEEAAASAEVPLVRAEPSHPEAPVQRTQRPAPQRAPSTERPRQAELDDMGRPAIQRPGAAEDNLEIPAFLRRQAN